MPEASVRYRPCIVLPAGALFSTYQPASVPAVVISCLPQRQYSRRGILTSADCRRYRLAGSQDHCFTFSGVDPAYLLAGVTKSLQQGQTHWGFLPGGGEWPGWCPHGKEYRCRAYDGECYRVSYNRREVVEKLGMVQGNPCGWENPNFAKAPVVKSTTVKPCCRKAAAW